MQLHAFIENVITDEKFRKRGLATQCLDYAKAIAIKENCYKIMLLTGSKIKKAHWIFTERQGITVTIKQHLFNGYSVAKETLDLYVAMQNLNRETIKYAADMIKVGMNLPDIKALCENYLLENGADSFWYWDVGAFVFAGDETVVSVSGKDYKVTDRTVQKNDIITIDLSPQMNNIWGDYARTLVFENGVLCDETDRIKNEEWRRGLQMEEYLHKTLIDVATPDMTFEELYYFMNDLIVKKGFLNLDFLGNLGHSIVKHKNDRIYTEKGNHKRLSDVEMFTFEPHISFPGSQYGYKREDIYYFDNGKLIKL